MTSNPEVLEERRSGRRMAIAMLIVGLLIGGLFGVVLTYYYGPSKTTSSSTSSIYALASSNPFSIGAAGTLQYAWGTLTNNTFEELYPNIKVAQLYEGSGSVATTEVATKQFSIEAAADTTVIPEDLFQNITDYEIAFGQTQMVIILDTATASGASVYSLWQTAQTEPPLSSQWNSTWQQIFTTIALDPNTVVGVSNPFTDPSGFQGAGMLRLAGLAFFGNVSELYDAVYMNPTKYKMQDTETDLVTLVQTGQVDFVISAYESNAIPQTSGVANLAYITLPDFINLGTVSEINYYYQGNFNYTELGTTESYVLNPVTYCLTIPKPSTNPNAAILYAETLFSPAGATTLESYGITPLMPALVYGNDNSVPSELLPFTTPVNSTDSSLFTGG